MVLSMAAKYDFDPVRVSELLRCIGACDPYIDEPAPTEAPTDCPLNAECFYIGDDNDDVASSALRLSRLDSDRWRFSRRLKLRQESQQQQQQQQLITYMRSLEEESFHRRHLDGSAILDVYQSDSSGDVADSNSPCSSVYSEARFFIEAVIEWDPDFDSSCEFHRDNG